MFIAQCTGALTRIEELVRVADPDGWKLRLGEADVLCCGVLPSGRWGKIAAIRFSCRRPP